MKKDSEKNSPNRQQDGFKTHQLFSIFERDKMDIRKKVFTNRWTLYLTDLLVTYGILTMIAGTYLIFDGGVYLVSGEGIVPAYSFTKTSLIGLFAFLNGVASTICANTIRTTSLGWQNE